MKRFFYIAAALAALASCAPKEARTMARFVPERADDFVWENDLVCYRAYGQALEGNPTAPGFDVWVKLPGALVADQRYRDEIENHKSYHINWGNGKDCYKVAVSLGCGGSSPIVNGALRMPATNYRSYDILKNTPDEQVFTLHYPAWMIDDVEVALDKTITVKAGTYFCDVEDIYTFTGAPNLTIAAGVVRHDITDEKLFKDGFAFWEHASDQSVEPEDGMIGLALRMQEPSSVGKTTDGLHSICTKTIKSGEPVRYSFASCWSKGDVKTAKKWFKIAGK